MKKKIVMGTISRKLIKQISKIETQKVIHISDLRKVAEQAKVDEKAIKTIDKLDDYHPIHAVYIATQNLVSLLAEKLSELPELDEYYNIVGDAEDDYMPGSMSFSPITTSYFTCWAFFDAQFGKDKETIGTCLLDIGQDFVMAWDDLEVIKLMQESRMGIYEHVGYDGKYVHLSDLFTDKEYKCLVPAGYYGKKKELWYVRILPAPFNTSNESLVFTTPYVLLATKKRSWIEFVLNRSVKPRTVDPILAIEAFMKYGPKKYYWNEYIFQSYLHHRSNVIFLAGLPGERYIDAKRKPHNPLNIKGYKNKL